MLTGDVGRTAVLARDDRLDDAALALFHPLKFMLASPAEDADRDHRPARADGLGRGQVRRDPRPAPPRRATRSACTAATCTTSAASSRRSSPAARGSGWAGILDGEMLACSDGDVLPFLAAPGAARPEGPVGGDPGRGAGDLRRVRRCSAAGRRRRVRRRRADGVGAAPRASRSRSDAGRLEGSACRSPTTAARFALSHLVDGGLGGRARGGVRARPGPAATRA